MPRTARPVLARTDQTARRRGGTTLGVLLILAAVVTAGAPAVITVRHGDTLWDLAREHGTSVAALKQLNNLPGRGTIYAGDTLQIPSRTPAAVPRGASAAKERTHVVRRGDTLSEIAVTYGVNAATVASRNGLRGSMLQIGRTLAIPAGAAKGGLGAVPETNAGVRVPDTVRRSVAQHRTALADRRLPAKAEVRQMVAATARRHGVSPSLAVAVAYHESGFQQRVVSGVDAIGVMQVLPSTGRALGQQHGRSLDLLDTQDNVTAGVLLLRQLSRSTTTSDEVLAAYYQGLGSIGRRGILPQTTDYVRNVNGLQGRFANG